MSTKSSKNNAFTMDMNLPNNPTPHKTKWSVIEKTKGAKPGEKMRAMVYCSTINSLLLYKCIEIIFLSFIIGQIRK